eukprot:9240933-Lingulodinium_polyedra.AAC.1
MEYGASSFLKSCVDWYIALSERIHGRRPAFKAVAFPFLEDGGDKPWIASAPNPELSFSDTQTCP